MEAYRKFLADLAERKDDRIFLNADTEHAIAVMVQIFKSSEKTVRIFAGSLCNEVGDEPVYIRAMRDFIEKGGVLNVLLNNYEETAARNSVLFKYISPYMSEGNEFERNVSFRVTDTTVYFEGGDSRNEVHFCIGDDRICRIEDDIIRRSAVCSFNRPDVAQRHIAFFDNLFTNSNQIHPYWMN